MEYNSKYKFDKVVLYEILKWDFTLANVFMRTCKSVNRQIHENTTLMDKLAKHYQPIIEKHIAFELSRKLGLCPQGDVDKVRDHLIRAGLPAKPQDISDIWNVDALMNAMSKDKKVSDGKLVFILAKGIGKSFVEKEIDSKIIRDIVELVIA